MTATNNSLNILQEDGEILVGSTGNAPVSTLITGSGMTTITPGPGTLDISSGFNYVRVPNTGDDVILQRDTIYYTDLTGVQQNFLLPTEATAGSMFYVLSANTNITANSGFNIKTQVGTTQKIFFSDAVSGTTLSFSTLELVGGVGSVLLICVDAPSPGSEIFQVCGMPTGSAFLS